MREIPPTSPLRSFDPRLVGTLECQTWVSYYRREWWTFLRAAVRVVRHAFGLGPARTVLGAWWVLRANQVWAPYPDNDPEAARCFMRHFYALVARAHEEDFDVAEAARLEVEWWRVHRILQHAEAPPAPDAIEELIAALQALYAHTYGVSPEAVRTAAEQRAEAMRLSDQWVREGTHRTSPLVPQERAALVRSYAALLAAVDAA